MDEKHYKQTYSSINPNQCVFEKAINSRICNCGKSQRFNLADREGVACQSNAALTHCKQFLKQLHDLSRFTLRRLDDQPLGHAQDIKIQNGGLLALQSEVISHQACQVNDVHALISSAEDKFNGIDNFPYSKMMQVINAYRIRPKRPPRK